MTCRKISFDSGAVFVPRYWDKQSLLGARNQKAELEALHSQVAVSNLKELVVSLALAGATIPFVATGIGQIALLATAITTAGFNALVRTCELDIDSNSNLPKTAKTGMRYARAATFSILDGTTRDVLTHEMGHALAAKALFIGANPKVTIFPLTGGVTHWAPWKGLTSLGQYFGASQSRLIVSAAGAGFALLFSLGFLIAAHGTTTSNPETSTYLFTSAIMSIAGHFTYAISALAGSGSSGHDFIALAKGGIHPLVAAAFIVAVPLALQLGLSTFFPANSKA